MLRLFQKPTHRRRIGFKKLDLFFTHFSDALFGMVHSVIVSEVIVVERVAVLSRFVTIRPMRNIESS